MREWLQAAVLAATIAVPGCAAAQGAPVTETAHRLTPEQQRALLQPYRDRINALDAQIVALLGQRFDVVREVADLKARNGIAPILPDRIEEVVKRARARAAETGIDPDLVEKIYRILIDEACKLEADYAYKVKAGK